MQRDSPLPIPNREVKTVRADGTAQKAGEYVLPILKPQLKGWGFFYVIIIDTVKFGFILPIYLIIVNLRKKFYSNEF